MAAIDDALTQLEASTTANTDAGASAVALLGKLNQLYKDALAAGGTPQVVVDRVTALNSAIMTHTQSLADAIVANTPAEA